MVFAGLLIFIILSFIFVNVYMMIRLEKKESKFKDFTKRGKK